MGQFDQGLQPTASADDFERLILEEFRSAWEQAIAGIPLPDINSFLSRGGAGDFSDLAKRLEALDLEYRKRLLSGNSAQPAVNSAAEQRFSIEKTVIGAVPGDTSQSKISWNEPDSPEFAGTVDWVPQADQAGAPDSPYAATVVGDTAKADNDPTDDPGGAANGKPSLKQRVAGYEVLGILGRGGMGVVYRARQVGLNRFVALKMILHGKHAGPEVLNRFRAEAEAVAQLQHPNIVQIYDIGTHEGLPFFSLELVDGPSLAAELAGQPMQPLRAAELLETLARAMHYAHIRGIVHRDLKPTNVLLTSKGVPKVTDFGLVKRLEADDSEQTRTGIILGTPSYMAPEQAWGSKEVGPLADVYSLGATLYALLTGRPPFIGPTASETVLLLRNEEPVPPSKLLPSLPRDLETICLKCLQKEPEKRYADAEQLAEDLRRFQAGEPILARPVGKTERLWRWCKRNPALAASGGGAMVLAVCLLIGGPMAAFLINKERDAAVEAQGQAEANERLATENAGLASQQRDYAVLALEVLVERVPTLLKGVPGTDEVKRNLLLTAMDGLNKIGGVGGERNKDFVMAKAFAKMGEVLLDIGEAKAAREQFLQSHAMLLNLAKTETETAESVHHLRLGRSYRNLGRAAERLEGAEAAYDLYQDSLKAREQALPLHSDRVLVLQEIAESLGELTRTALDLGLPREAAGYCTRSIAFLDEWRSLSDGDDAAVRALAGTQLQLGHIELALGGPDKAVQEYQKSLEALRQLTQKQNASATDQTNAALCHLDLGTAFFLLGDALKSKGHFQVAVPALEEAYRNNKRSAFLLRKLGKAYYWMTTACQELNDPEALRYSERSVAARKLLFDKAPDDRAARQDYMLSLARDGKILEAAEKAKEIATMASEAPDALYMVACTYALCALANPSETQPPIPSPEAFRRLAMSALREAVNQGYHAPAMIKLDPDLVSVRNEDDFHTLVSELERQDKVAGN